MTYVIDLHRLWENHADGANKSPINVSGGFGRVSVVLVVRGEYDLFRSLNTVMSQAFLREVVIVDIGLSALQRQSLDSFVKEQSRCHVINGRKQMGLAHAYNLGSHYCTGDYLFFMSEKVLLPKNALAKPLAFARRKTPPYIIGLSEGTIAENRGMKREHWISKLTRFQTFSMGATFKQGSAAFVHTAKVQAEGLFVSNRSFALLKGMDEDCSDEAMSWDFSLRSHYAGGDVLEAKGVPIEYQTRIASKSWCKHLCTQWKNYRSWCYFYQKYVSSKTHFFARITGYTFFFLQFLWDSLLSKPQGMR